MIKRVIEVSSASYLHIRHRQLVIDQGDDEVGSVPLEDLGVLVIANPGNVLTQQLLAECAENNVIVVLCNSRYLPGSVLLPLSGHSLHAMVLQVQAQAKSQVKGRLWRQIVRAKIGAQHSLLTISGNRGELLLRLMAKVKPGDPENCEAQAARHYWQELFGKDFRREQFSEGVNAVLNYGYTIIRSCVARAIVGAGLHPALGLQHCSEYNDFALADDLVEPLRPLVDEMALNISKRSQGPVLDREARRVLLELTAAPCKNNGRIVPLMVALQEYAASLRACLKGESKLLEIPVCLFSVGTEPCGSL